MTNSSYKPSISATLFNSSNDTHRASVSAGHNRTSPPAYSANSDTITHGYILFFITTTPKNIVVEKEHLTWASLDKLDTPAIVPSDKWLLQHKLNEHVDVTEEILEEEQETYTLNITK